ncbi:MAG: glycosyltransferase [Clostridia bacterium]
MNNILYVVIPCFNEEEVLLETAKRLRIKFLGLMKKNKISIKSRVLFVDDGSTDKTYELITKLHSEKTIFLGLKLSRNRGHQNALLAGLLKARDNADMIISIDADLQDDINAIDEMVDKYLEGCDIVYGVRNKRKTDSFFKRTTAQLFYKLLNRLGANTVYNHADYRLMSKRAVDALSEFKEVNLFLRGIVPMIGFRTDYVYYDRTTRFAGKSKYPLNKMIAFALEGITSLSTKPIKLISLLGFGIFGISIIMFIYSIIQFLLGNTVIGWPSVIVSVWAIGGLMLLSIGVIGEYIGKIYLETKSRPLYIVDEFLDNHPKNEH